MDIMAAVKEYADATVSRADLQKPMEECANPEEGKEKSEPINTDEVKIFDKKPKVLTAVLPDAEHTAPRCALPTPTEEEKKQSHPTNKDKRKIFDIKEYVLAALEEHELSNPMENCRILKDWREEWDLFDTEELKTFDMKLKVLEFLEEQKRKGLKKLANELEELRELQSEIKSLEELLKINNIEIDEEKYEMFCNSQMSEESLVEPLDFAELYYQTSNQGPQEKRIKISATSKPTTAKPKVYKFKANEDGMVTIGPNGTMIDKTYLEAINWSLSGAAITRKILVEVFGRHALASHSLTGKPSPAFMDCDKPLKNQLDPLKVADIIHLITQCTKLSAKDVRNAITTKCADENKMFRKKEEKKLNATANIQ